MLEVRVFVGRERIVKFADFESAIAYVLAFNAQRKEGDPYASLEAE